MKIFKLFHRGKKGEEKKVEAVKEPPKLSELEVICGDDNEVYKALEETLPLAILSFPKEFSMEETLERARAKEEAAMAEKGEAEKKDLLHRAGLEYRMAGQIALFNAALFNGDIEDVKKFFGKAQELTGKRYLILAVLDRAVEKARDYYQKKKEEDKQKK